MDGEDATASSTGAVASEGETKAQQQARLRRERRNAKIQAGGSERLSKITSLSGRPVAAEAELFKTPTPPRASPSAKPLNTNESPIASQTHGDAAAEDPDEVDISTADQQRELFRQLLMSSNTNTPPNASQPGPGAASPDDQFSRMLQQMLGASGMSPDGSMPTAGGPNGFPTGGLGEILASLTSGGRPEETEPNTTPVNLWRIVHAVCALMLGAWIAFTTPGFTGTQVSREEVYVANAAFAATETSGWAAAVRNETRLFWMFATVELVLQSTRYWADGGQLPRSGLLNTVSRVLPSPYKDWVALASRYFVMWTALIADVAVLIFVLGAVTWWRNGGATELVEELAGT